MKHYVHLLWASVAAACLAAGCGGSDSGRDVSTPPAPQAGTPPPVAPPPAPTPVPTPPLPAPSPAPEGAPLLAQRIFFPAPPARYTHVLAWAQVTTLSSTTASPATAEVDFMRLVEENPANGAQNVVAELTFDRDRPSCDGVGCEGGNFVRSPWFGQGGSSIAMSNSTISSGRLVIDAARAPDRIAHWWTPRVAVRPGMRYMVESSFRIQGAAAIEFGVDYWVGQSTPYTGYDASCNTTNNCEAWVSDWFGDTAGQFVTRIAPRW